MLENEWFIFDKQERKVLMDALRNFEQGRNEKTGPIISKLLDSGMYPDITVGVYGGQVQWVMGNPFPIRICDYDGDKSDLIDRDEQDQECRIWFEPADSFTG